MVYNDTVTKLGVLQECERKCNLGDAGITGDTEMLANFTAYCNEALRSVWHWIFDSYGGWQYDDSNQTDLPAATATITDSQNTYSLPSTALTIKSVSVKDENDNWYDLEPITEDIIQERSSIEEFYETDGSPRYYDLVGNTMRLFPASDYTQLASLKVLFDRGSVAFASTDTTQTPGFASEYHGVIPTLASIAFLEVKFPESGSLKLYMNAINDPNNGFIERIKTYYAKRFDNMTPIVLRKKPNKYK